MTGLDVNKEVIIEVGAIVTDINFNELETYHAIVKQPQSYLNNMDAWNTKTHRESGLTAKVPQGREQYVVERELVELTEYHFGDEPAIIAGNSISQDRIFLEKYMPGFCQRLHYRMLDVSSWKVIFREKYGKSYQKQNAHRAIDDIRESIGEMKFYMSFIHVPDQKDTDS